MGSAEAIMHDADMKYDWCCVYWSGNSNHKICHCRRHFIKILHYFAKIIQQQNKRQVPNTLHSTLVMVVHRHSRVHCVGRLSHLHTSSNAATRSRIHCTARAISSDANNCVRAF